MSLKKNYIADGLRIALFFADGLLFLITQENHSIDDHDPPKKPSQSYLEIIAEAILKTPARTMQLFEIYNYFRRK